jgi:hypothetical protein
MDNYAALAALAGLAESFSLEAIKNTIQPDPVEITDENGSGTGEFLPAEPAVITVVWTVGAQVRNGEDVISLRSEADSPKEAVEKHTNLLKRLGL